MFKIVSRMGHRARLTRLHVRNEEEHYAPVHLPVSKQQFSPMRY